MSGFSFAPCGNLPARQLLGAGIVVAAAAAGAMNAGGFLSSAHVPARVGSALQSVVTFVREYDGWYPCAVQGGVCRCTGTMVFSNLFGVAIREANVDGQARCTAEALGANAHLGPRICWCQSGVVWGDVVRSGLASIVRQGLTPRIEIAGNRFGAEAGCSAEGNNHWHGCVILTSRSDTSFIPQVMLRAIPAEEHLDASLRKLDACHRLAPRSALRVLGVAGGQASDSVLMPVSTGRVCSVVYQPEEGALWTAKTDALHCATKPGTCTTTLCECKRPSETKIEMHTPQGQKCWACAEPGNEHAFRLIAQAENTEGGAWSWWPPYGINCPPILWAFMDWRAVTEDCPAVSMYFVFFLVGLVLRKFEELFGGVLPWTRVAPLFGPTLKRGEVWRLFSYTFFHVQFADLFQNLLMLLDAIDIERTPAIVLGDGSNLKCGVGAKENYMCYPSIGIGTFHTLGVALVSTAVGGMCSTWFNFRAVVTGASALGFGFSGAIVALYGLYAGAELDAATSVQRSFQDWVVLRLVFVGIHIVMEWIRSLSQRDVTGFIAHTASFIAGFAYVICCTPPMGDGTLFSSPHPYILPCGHDSSSGRFAGSSRPECVRIFSRHHEYELSTLKEQLRLALLACIAFTALNAFIFQRLVSSREAVLLAGHEVSAICIQRAAVPHGIARAEDRTIVLWCELVSVGTVRPPQGDFQPVVEVRICAGGDPQKHPGRALAARPAASGRTSAPMSRETATLEWKENIFLPASYKDSKTSFVQIILWDLRGGTSEALGSLSLPLPRALRNTNGHNLNEMRLALLPLGSRGRCILGSRWLTSSRVRVGFRCLEIEDLRQLRTRLRSQIESGLPKLRFFEDQLAALEGEPSAA